MRRSRRAAINFTSETAGHVVADDIYDLVADPLKLDVYAIPEIPYGNGYAVWLNFDIFDIHSREALDWAALPANPPPERENKHRPDPGPQARRAMGR